MGLAADVMAAGGYELLALGLENVAVTYAAGTNTKAIPSSACSRKDLVRAGGDGLDQDTCTFLIPPAQFLTGFSSTNPVRPSEGHVVTVSGEEPWTVREAPLPLGAVYVIRVARRRQRGAA